MTSNDYPFIRAWGRIMGSHRDYIDHQVELAREDQAPPDAIYRRDDGTWATTDEILRSDTRCRCRNPNSPRCCHSCVTPCCGSRLSETAPA